jgi:hypothetical protein
MGRTETHYFTVENLSMGGARLVAHKGVNLDVKTGDILEVLLFSGELSLRCVVKVAQGGFSGAAELASEEPDKCVHLGVELVGIDERSRKVLGDFLQKLAVSQERT